MEDKLARISEGILKTASEEYVSMATLENSMLKSLPTVFFSSRSQLRNHIDAEVSLGRLEVSSKGLKITERGRKKLEMLQE